MTEQEQWFAANAEVEGFGLSLAGDTGAYAGHLGKARELTERSVDSALQADSKEERRNLLGDCCPARGCFRQPGRSAAGCGCRSQAGPCRPGRQAPKQPLTYAMIADMASAETLAQTLDKRYPLDAQSQSARFACHSGVANGEPESD